MQWSAKSKYLLTALKLANTATPRKKLKNGWKMSFGSSQEKVIFV